jgi:hypothetical protein
MLLVRLAGLSVVIAIISHMAYRYLSNRLVTSTLRINSIAPSKSHLDTVSNWSTMSSNGYATVSYVTTPNEDVARQLAR